MHYKHLTLFLTTIVVIALASCHNEKKSEKRSDTSSTMVTTTDTTAPTKTGNAETTEQINDSCIGRYFTVDTVSDSLWNMMQNNNIVDRTELRRIRVLHWDSDNKTHQGEMICHRSIADTLIYIFRELYKAKYPIQRIVPAHRYSNDDEKQMQDNNTSCYSPRTVKGTTVMSKHACGLAVDLNPLYNPYYRARKNGSPDVLPHTATPFVDREKDFSYKIDHNDLAYKLFTSHGFRWGGDWKSCKDYQHFER